MKGLLLKEFLLLKKFRIWYIFLCLFFGAIGILSPGASLFISLFMSISICGNVSTDEQSKWSVYSHSLPFERKKYVDAKYTTALILTLAAVIITVIIYLISIPVWRLGLNIKLTFFLCAISMGVSLIPLSVYLPFAYRFNSQTGGIVLAIAYMGAIMCLPIVFLVSIMGELLAMLPAVSTSLIIMAVILAVFLLSWFISVKIYEKRDL